MDNVLTVEDVARLLKVKAITVREMLREQRIRGFKVGKAWRTTEKMLEEDLETIARGAKPEPLEAQRVLAAQPKRSRGGRKPTKVQSSEAATAKAAKQERPASSKRGARSEEAASEAPEKPTRRGAKSTDKMDDQGLLF